MPLHRSLVFWLGVTGLLFLLWAWRDSEKNFTSWSIDCGNDRTRVVGVSNSGVTFMSLRPVEALEYPEPLLPTGPTFGSFDRVSIAPVDETDWFPEARIRAPLELVGGDSYEQIRRFVPIWLLVLCYLPPWLGLSAWRARRIGKARAALGLGTAHPEGTAG